MIKLCWLVFLVALVGCTKEATFDPIPKPVEGRLVALFNGKPVSIPAKSQVYETDSTFVVLIHAISNPTGQGFVIHITAPSNTGVFTMQHGYTSLTYGTAIGIDGAKSFYNTVCPDKMSQVVITEIDGQKKISGTFEGKLCGPTSEGYVLLEVTHGSFTNI